MATGAVVRQVRRQAGLTQSELANRAGTSQAMVARYESEAASPTVRTLERLLRAAGHELVITSVPVEPKVLLDVSTEHWHAVRRHRAQIRAAARAAGARNVRVFGSVARGDARPDSDLDLLVDFPVREQGLLPLILLAERIEALVGRPVDIAAESALRPEVLASALAEAVPL